MDAVQLSETVVCQSNGEGIWHKKYSIMKRKCEEYEELNSIMLTRTKKIREMICQSEAEKRLLMKRLEQFGMVAFRMSPPSSPQYEQLSQPKAELRTPPPLAIEDPLLPLSAHEFKPPPALSPLPTPKAELSPKPPTSKQKPTKGKGGGRKRKGDGNSNVPKKPSNAFFWFCQEHRGSLQDQFRGEGVAGQHDLTKILAKLWSEATAEDKQQYYQKYDVDKRRYDREMKAFVASEQQKATTVAHQR